MNRKKILMIQPNLQPPGGGQSVCAWMLQALKGSYDLSVLSWRPVDLAPVNHFFGTSLTAGDITFLKINPVLRACLGSFPTTISLLKSAILYRYCRRMQRHYDVLITANNEADFGRPGIQYIHYPWNKFPRPDVDIRWYHFGFALSAYYRLCRAIGGFSAENISRNITLVNSGWTADRLMSCYPEIAPTIVYPPVAGNFSTTPWPERENGFLCIGRISPEKQLGKIVGIMEKIRALGHDVHLHIIGTPDDDAYFARIERLAREHASFVTLEQSLSRDELVRRISSHRYGIHGMPDEHFGMSVAEMLTGGCIVFVPDGGGQTEIVGDSRELRYLGPDDAVKKIHAVLSSAAEQERLRALLLQRAQLFSVERFIKQLRDIVGDFAHKQLRAGC